MKFTIVRNLRYGLYDEERFPSKLTCEGTAEQAQALAEWMSDAYPGCEWIFACIETDPLEVAR